MATRATRIERCRAGKHTPVRSPDPREGDVGRAVCRYCKRPIMRTQATRVWFLAGVLT